ncbi:hypothetical protein [Flagellimonas marinaquae]|uniref:hypothetical protein n=1 Tax=Flagellimonas marinaquae TaxID=254955 RepID=UPI002074DC0B|nr:hypothetical protein [Allomuricauda aquimarina]USD23866.1 hypothetical protein MJO53_09230 [Allomuricauda aquimarina]
MKYLYILLLSIFFTDCVSIPKGYVANDNTCHYNDPIFKINKEELTLNQNILNQLKNKEGDLVLVDNESFKNEYYKFSNGGILNLKTDKTLNIDKNIGFYPNGKIKYLFFEYTNGYKKIFKEFDYNEQGEITKVIDYEKGYNICWTEAIEIVKKIAKKDIEKYKITQFNLPFRVDLNKFTNEKPEWGVMLEKNENYEPKENKVYWIDGVTGKFLRTTKIIITHD